MEIKVLGTGCATCKALYRKVQQAVEELGIEAQVVKEEDLTKIISYNVWSLPAIVIDERVVAKGSRSLSEVIEIINQHSK